MPATKHLSTMAKAFCVGGLICMIGQAIYDIYTLVLKNLEENVIKSFTTVTLILITAILTGLGIYDKIGAFAGAGSIVPITGFANSVVSSAEEHKREGLILGLCANMYAVAGPVIVIGIVSSIVIGIFALVFRGLFS